ncbi:trans-aconitate 2-methyltransferase [Verrucomicrobia bacterium LW23]|nr:trans-aconitate 2-methyltransferase [Verrucomicrobia bacterium LW23]
MPSWDPSLYLKYADERTQPCRDLIHRVQLTAPEDVVDLGCGPGNSTAVLAARWPLARITGLDSSAEMLARAHAAMPRIHWQQGDIASWTAEPAEEAAPDTAGNGASPAAAADGAGRPQLVFSNAALQWVPDHFELVPRLFAQVAPGGALAVQVPAQVNAPAHVIMRELTQSAAWRSYFPMGSVRDWHVHEPGVYFDLLSPLTSRLDMWLTDYMMYLPGPQSIVDWYQGTGMRPYLDALPSDELRRVFMADVLAEVAVTYPARSNGMVEFPFRRLFFVAYR